MAARKSTKAAAPAVEKNDITNDTLIACRNGTIGHLIYKSSLTPGYIVEWDEFGEVQELEYRELVSIRASQRRFFEDNWLLIDDEAVLRKLGVERYYRNALTADNFEDVFNMSASEITSVVPTLSNGTKDAIAARAVEKIENGEFDSRSGIKALGAALNVDFEESI